MKSFDPSRRALLVRAAQAPAAGALLAALTACGGNRSGTGSADSTAGSAVCVDLAKMSAGDRQSRQSLGYMDMSQNAATVCAGCSFFHPSDSGGICGTCDVFSGGPVNSKGHCNSWNAKA